MLERAERTLRAGEVVGGGRPGLVTLMLTPFVRDCVDAVATAANARVLWFILTLAYLCGVFFLVRNWFRFSLRNERGCFEGAAAVTLLAFLPSFVAWSVQVRSDQPRLRLPAGPAYACCLDGFETRYSAECYLESPPFAPRRPCTRQPFAACCGQRL